MVAALPNTHQHPLCFVKTIDRAEREKDRTRSF